MLRFFSIPIRPSKHNRLFPCVPRQNASKPEAYKIGLLVLTDSSPYGLPTMNATITAHEPNLYLICISTRHRLTVPEMLFTNECTPIDVKRVGPE